MVDIYKLMRKLANDERSCADVAALAADIIAANFRFNEMMLTAKDDTRISDEWFMESIDFLERTRSEVEEAVKTLSDTGDKQALCATLVKIRDDINARTR